MNNTIPKVAILIDDMYQNIDVWYPYTRLRQSGVQTVLVGIEKKEYRSDDREPHLAAAEATIKEASTQNFAAVIIPGGYASYILSRNREVKKFVKEMHNNGNIVAAISHGVWVLISSGVLRGKAAAVFFAIRTDLGNASAKFTDKEVVVDGKVITSPKSMYLPAFCRQLINTID
jgi:protease I